jgi:hypothetical protein
LIPCLILLAVAALFAWLIFAKVFVSYENFAIPTPPAERFERGWPWVFLDTFEHLASGSSPPQTGPTTFFPWALAADLAVALVVLLIVAMWLRRRLRRPRPWQLSLRAALIAVAVIACASGWLAREYRLWQREQQSIEALSRWKMRKAFAGPHWLLRFRSREKLEMFHRVVEAMTPVLRRTEAGLVGLSDDDLRSFTTALPSFPRLRTVEVADTMPAGFDEFDQWTAIERLIVSGILATDDVLRRVSRMPRLKSLNLYMAEEVTNEGFAHLANLKRLEELNLDSTSVTDRGIAALARLPRLRALSATGTALSDASIPSLCQIQSLEKLEIYGTHITDAGARRLAELPKLKELWLPFNSVSEKTAESLREQIAWVLRY